MIARRRELVFELYWKNKSSREIVHELATKKGIDISFKTVCNDIEWLKNNAEYEVRRQKDQIALDYKEAEATFMYLKKEAIEQFELAKENKDGDRMEHMYDIISNITKDLYNLRNTSDIIEREVVYNAQQQAQTRKEELMKATPVSS